MPRLDLIAAGAELDQALVEGRALLRLARREHPHARQARDIGRRLSAGPRTPRIHETLDGDRIGVIARNERNRIDPDRFAVPPLAIMEGELLLRNIAGERQPRPL